MVISRAASRASLRWWTVVDEVALRLRLPAEQAVCGAASTQALASFPAGTGLEPGQPFPKDQPQQTPKIGGAGFLHPPRNGGEREAGGDAASWIGDVGSGVTYCKNRYLHIEFLKSDQAFNLVKHWESWVVWIAIASCAGPRRSHATKCLLRRQTKSQRDFVHHRRLAREGALDMTTPHPQSLSPLRGEGSQWRCGRLDWRRWQRCNIL